MGKILNKENKYPWESNTLTLNSTIKPHNKVLKQSFFLSRKDRTAKLPVWLDFQLKYIGQATKVEAVVM